MKGSFNLVVLLFVIELILFEPISFLEFFSGFVKGFIDNFGNFVLFKLLIWFVFKFPNSSFIIIISSESSISFKLLFIPLLLLF